MSTTTAPPTTRGWFRRLLRVAVLCFTALAIVLWIHSYIFEMRFQVGPIANRILMLDSDNGAIGVDWVTPMPPIGPDLEFEQLEFAVEFSHQLRMNESISIFGRWYWRYRSKAYDASSYGGYWTDHRLELIFPYWVVALPMVLLSALLIWRGKQAVRGLCPGCHYDLRGRADAATCPECGKALKVG